MEPSLRIGLKIDPLIIDPKTTDLITETRIDHGERTSQAVKLLPNK